MKRATFRTDELFVLRLALNAFRAKVPRMFTMTETEMEVLQQKLRALTEADQDKVKSRKQMIVYTLSDDEPDPAVAGWLEKNSESGS